MLVANQPIQTPSTHRQRFAPGSQLNPQMATSNTPFNAPAGTPMLQKRPSPRQPLANLGINTGGGSGFSGYGMSAGMKVSNPASTAALGGSRPVVRSRGPISSSPLIVYLANTASVAQRPVSGLQVSRESTSAPPNMFSNGTGQY